MKINVLKLKIISFYKVFFAPHKQWRRPKKSEVLIYDSAGSDVFTPYLTKFSFEIIPSRGESVNVLCLARAVFKLSFWKGRPIQAYVEAFIQLVSPRVIITFIDNDVGFYGVSNCFPDIKTIFLQNGARSELGDVFGHLVKHENYHVDYMLVHGSAIGQYYKKFVSGQTVTIGSFKSNHVKRLDKIETGSILFISQYHEKSEDDAPLFIEVDGTEISWDKFFSAEVKVLNFLEKWCAENNKILRICARGRDQDGPEKRFFSNVFQNRAWEYLPRTDMYSSYKSLDSAEIVVAIDSTLCYESIGRGKKTAGFSCRGASLNNEATKFGWPAGLPENGPFWTNDADERQFQRVMDYLNTVGADEWERNRQIYAKELMEFDAGNSRFIALLDQLLPKSEKSSHAQ